MSPHKQAWQHFSSPRGMKFPQGRYRGYPQCLPRGHPVSGGTSPGHRRARSPLPSLGPVPAELTTEAQLAELGQSHRGFAKHLLEVRDPEGSEAAGVIRVGMGNPRPSRARNPSEPPILESPHPAQRSPGRVGRGNTTVPTQTPTPTCSGAAATWRPQRPFPARRINTPAGNAARGRGMRDGPAPRGRGDTARSHTGPSPAWSPAPTRLRAPFLSAEPRPLCGKAPPPLRPAHGTEPRPRPAPSTKPRPMAVTLR